MQMKSIAATVLTGSIISMGSIVAAHASGDFVLEQQQPFWVTKECKTQDQVNCHWDKNTHRDLRGHSYIVRLVPGPKHHQIVCVFYVNRKFAKHHDYCS